MNNTYLGTVPNTYCWNAFAGHNTHDVIIEGNTAQPVGPSGKTWRFLVLTGTGNNDRVANNTIVGIGPRDSDTQDVNAAEIILAESYSLQFEGMPSISPDGRILQIPPPQGGPATTGDLVAILSGPEAGTFRRIAQAIGPQTYWMDRPLPAGQLRPSRSSRGFLGETFQGNVIDARGGSGAGGLVLVGNHFGTQVLGNHILGGGQAFKITAAPSEHPDIWGWSHAAVPRARRSMATSSRIPPAARSLSVEHSAAIKSVAGRVYFSGSLTNNIVAWTPGFLAGRSDLNIMPGILVGDLGSLDPAELRLTTSDNRADVPDGCRSRRSRSRRRSSTGRWCRTRASRSRGRSSSPPPACG